jgi:hypothetical protein
MFYNDVKLIVDEFAEGADDMLHGWSTDIVEGTNIFSPRGARFPLSKSNSIRSIIPLIIVK